MDIKSSDFKSEYQLFTLNCEQQYRNFQLLIFHRIWLSMGSVQQLIYCQRKKRLHNTERDDLRLMLTKVYISRKLQSVKTGIDNIHQYFNIQHNKLLQKRKLWNYIFLQEGGDAEKVGNFCSKRSHRQSLPAYTGCIEKSLSKLCRSPMEVL